MAGSPDRCSTPARSVLDPVRSAGVRSGHLARSCREGRNYKPAMSSSRDPGARWPSDSRRPKRASPARAARVRARSNGRLPCWARRSPAEVLVFNTLCKAFGPHAGAHDAFLLAAVLPVRCAAWHGDSAPARVRHPGCAGPTARPQQNPDVKTVAQGALDRDQSRVGLSRHHARSSLTKCPTAPAARSILTPMRARRLRWMSWQRAGR